MGCQHKVHGVALGLRRWEVTLHRQCRRPQVVERQRRAPDPRPRRVRECERQCLAPLVMRGVEYRYGDRLGGLQRHEGERAAGDGIVRPRGRVVHRRHGNALLAQGHHELERGIRCRLHLRIGHRERRRPRNAPRASVSLVRHGACARARVMA